VVELEQITTAPHLTFEALTAGDPDAPLVLLLHGFAESMHCWRAQVAALAAAGYRAVAPSQRGYSPGARPDTTNTANYHIERLIDDAVAIADACGHADRRFHLVGHDWGGSIAWSLADRFPHRLASLTVLSRPHPNAFNRALQMPDGDQAQRSRHHKAFLEPDAADVVLADNARWLRDRLAAAGVPDAAIEQQGRDGSGAGVVSRARRDPRAARRNRGADAVHLGRRRRHRRARRGRGHKGFCFSALSLRGAAGRRSFRG
jgi:pimeloyl-ACP methyl ester carboxylesterase